MYLGVYFILLLERRPLSIGDTSSEDSSSSNSEADLLMDTLTGDDSWDGALMISGAGMTSGADSGTETISGTVC